MDYETLKREAAKYPDTMTNMERMKAYAMGQEVDRIPFSMAGADAFVNLYGYTLGEYRRSLDVQFDVAEKMKAEFCGSGMIGCGIAARYMLQMQTSFFLIAQKFVTDHRGTEKSIIRKRTAGIGTRCLLVDGNSLAGISRASGHPGTTFQGHAVTIKRSYPETPFGISVVSLSEGIGTALPFCRAMLARMQTSKMRLRPVVLRRIRGKSLRRDANEKRQKKADESKKSAVKHTDHIPRR